MEVHAHTHTERKKWTHYLWEFLMLFLAVFCGFLAEYQLEHKIEKDREKQFLRSLVNDIEADIDQLQGLTDRRNHRQIALDSTTLLLKTAYIKTGSNNLYFNAINAARRVDIAFVPNDGTFLQLKNSGGLRVIRNRKVVDSIMKYDVAVRNVVSLGNIELQLFDNYRIVAGRVFNTAVFDSMLDENNVATRPEGNSKLLSYDKISVDELLSSVYWIKVINKGLRRDFNKLKLQANSVIQTIKQEYHLK